MEQKLKLGNCETVSKKTQKTYPNAQNAVWRSGSSNSSKDEKSSKNKESSSKKEKGRIRMNLDMC